MSNLIRNLECKIVYSCCSEFLGFFHLTGLLFFLHVTLYVMINTIRYFLLGLFLNLIYFIPFFSFFYVLTFHRCSYCRSMEEKSFVLKRLIYEACRYAQGVSNGCNTKYTSQTRGKSITCGVQKAI